MEKEISSLIQFSEDMIGSDLTNVTITGKIGWSKQIEENNSDP
jgi:hypothetical protein